MRLPKWIRMPHADAIILIFLFIMLAGALRIVYKPRLVRNSPYFILIIINEQVPPFSEHWFTISTSGKIEFN